MFVVSREMRERTIRGLGRCRCFPVSWLMLRAAGQGAGVLVRYLNGAYVCGNVSLNKVRYMPEMENLLQGITECRTLVRASL